MKHLWGPVLVLAFLVIPLTGGHCQETPEIGAGLISADQQILSNQNYIMFYSTRADPPGYNFMRPDGSEVRRLHLPNLPAGYRLDGLSWNQDLRRFIAVLKNANHQDETFLIETDGTVVSRLASPEMFTGEYVYSPAAQKFAYTCLDFGLDVCVVDPDGQTPTNLTHTGALENHPVWTPDGKQIIYQSDWNGMPNVWRMDADGQNPTNLSSVYVSEINPSLSPDGSTILLESQRAENWDIYTMDLNGGNVTNLTNTPSPSAEHSPVWSPDGKSIAYFSDQDGGMDIFVINADGTNPLNLTKTKDRVEWTFVWSGDSQWIIYSVKESASTFNIYRVDRAGQLAVNLTNNTAKNVDPQWINGGYSPSEPRMLFPLIQTDD